MPAVPRLAVSATRGGLGKTTLSLGIIAAWRKRGRRVAVFKKGPDFIDAGWLGVAAGRPCYNLDLFIMEKGSILKSFNDHTMGADAAVIEGNRGLYDGVDESGTYSTARLTKLLKTPVVLIVDCTKASSTVGAVVLGCRNYDPEVDIKGIILNNVLPGRHESVVRSAIEKSSGLPVVGAVPRQRKGEFPERHMGLTPFHEHPEVDQAIGASAAVAEKYLDLDRVWNIACSASELETPEEPTETLISRGKDRVNIGVIRDRAFQFYYPDNLEALEHEGAFIREINALRDRTLPEIDALYIGGGFPETQAAELAANEGFCRSLRAAAENGLPIYAECGGLIYLGRSLKVDDSVYPMTSVLPVDFILEKRPQAHGYTIVEVRGLSPFLEKGVIIRGHEFHYSRIVNLDDLPPMAYDMSRGGGINGTGDGLTYKNVLACYTHLHAVGTPQWAGAMIRKAREYRKRKQEE
ncbi:MAG TPA: cobyrinate a,c-diamide synthase [Nitrospirota bacterium]|nr:cobyrinate a,c-diamide synthase [Nitrospirota bacterium]